jgi:hypothetical protein
MSDHWIEHNGPPVQLAIILRIATPDPSPLTLFPRRLGTEAALCQSNGSSVLQLSKIPRLDRVRIQSPAFQHAGAVNSA